jgi:hypothetical protein
MRTLGLSMLILYNHQTEQLAFDGYQSILYSLRGTHYFTFALGLLSGNRVLESSSGSVSYFSWPDLGPCSYRQLLYYDPLRIILSLMARGFWTAGQLFGFLAKVVCLLQVFYSIGGMKY